MATFSTAAEDAISRTLDLDEAQAATTLGAAGGELAELYEIESTAEEIVNGGFKQVALQFPDENLIDSVPVYQALRRAIAERGKAQRASEGGEERAKNDSKQSMANLYVLADTSYGSCCVDEVAAEHVNADLVVHYGHACMSPASRLPAIYVFTKRPISIEQTIDGLVEGLQQHLPALYSNMTSGEHPAADGKGKEVKAIVLMYDVGYTHATDELHRGIKRKLSKRAAPLSPSPSALSSESSKLERACESAEVPVVLSRLDRRANFGTRFSEGQQAKAVQGASPNVGSGPVTTCSCERKAPQSSGCCGGQASGQGNSDDQPAALCTTCSAPNGTSVSTVPEQISDPRQPSGSSSPRSYALPEGVSSIDECAILYVGGESLALTNVVITHPSCPIIAHDPHTEKTSLASARSNKLLMRRYALVQKARDADVIGILVGTLGVASYLPLITHLRTLLKRSNKKTYTISVGKLNPAKLANYMEIEAFVLVACPENSLVESKEFFKPIVTPWELVMALKGEGAWDSAEYALDFGKLVEGRLVGQQPSQERGSGDGKIEGSEGEQSRQGPSALSERDSDGEGDEDRPHFSLVTGQYKQSRRYYGSDDQKAEEELEEQQRAGKVAVRNMDGTVSKALGSAAGEFLSNRSWRGLEQRLGEDEPSQLIEGRSGIARGYDGDRAFYQGDNVGQQPENNPHGRGEQ